MSEQIPNEGKITDEFRNLGKNLAEALRSVWDSPERRRLQQELENGITEVGVTLRQEIDTFSDSPTGQRIKSEVEDARQRIRSGEAEAKVREELLSALRILNKELEKFSENLSSERSRPAQTPPQDIYTEGRHGPNPMGHQEVHPDDVDSGGTESIGREEVSPDDADPGSMPE